ncbi:MAG: hypothetical protein H0X40_17125 [Chthoniobacterales bacterium]|nr:hypothetical protein [Chthoniobacterales bacterium]
MPNGPNDIATFSSSADINTLPTIDSPIELDSLVFSAGCPEFFTIEIDGPLTISGAGMINNSGTSKEIFVKPYPAGELDFIGSAVITNCDISAVSRAIRFFDTSSAGNAFFLADSNVGGTGLIEFNDNSDGANTTIFLEASAQTVSPPILSIYNHQAPGMSIGSIAGGGFVLLGDENGPSTGRRLTVGSLNVNTTYQGVIQDAGKGGSIVKVGTGAFVLSGANLYAGATLVKAGQLVVANKSGSGTGTGRVTVSGRAVLAGTGTIAGAVTIGTGAGARSTLAPSNYVARVSTLTIQSLLTIKGGSVYNPHLYLNFGGADQVRANGVVLESGARFTFTGADQAGVVLGSVYQVIDNTSATPISGTFSNLADGAILTAGSNHFQANYEGGDGNDLTLTAVP